MIDNPFVTNGYAGPDYFCDRVEETALLTNLLTNGNNIALMSPRRVGKTDLMKHCFQQESIRDKYYCFVVDIYATNSFRDFVCVFGKSILDALKPKGRKAWEGFLNMLLSVRSEISFDINGNPVWGLGVGAMVPPQTAHSDSAVLQCQLHLCRFATPFDERDVSFAVAAFLSVGGAHEPRPYSH